MLLTGIRYSVSQMVHVWRKGKTPIVLLTVASTQSVKGHMCGAKVRRTPIVLLTGSKLLLTGSKQSVKRYLCGANRSKSLGRLTRHGTIHALKIMYNYVITILI